MHIDKLEAFRRAVDFVVRFRAVENASGRPMHPDTCVVLVHHVTDLVLQAAEDVAESMGGMTTPKGGEMNPYLKSYLRAIALGPKRSPYLTRRFAAINLVVLLAWWALGRPGDQREPRALVRLLVFDGDARARRAGPVGACVLALVAALALACGPKRSSQDCANWQRAVARADVAGRDFHGAPQRAWPEQGRIFWCHDVRELRRSCGAEAAGEWERRGLLRCPADTPAGAPMFEP